MNKLTINQLKMLDPLFLKSSQINILFQFEKHHFTEVKSFANVISCSLKSQPQF